MGACIKACLVGVSIPMSGRYRPRLDQRLALWRRVDTEVAFCLSVAIERRDRSMFNLRPADQLAPDILPTPIAIRGLLAGMLQTGGARALGRGDRGGSRASV